MGRSISINMNPYSGILKEHGFRNSGDNLDGFKIDMEYSLEASDKIELLEIKKLKDEDCMLEATCKLASGVGIDEAKSTIERIWVDELRYRDFEKHEILDIKNGFALQFVTTAPNLGVVGVIYCCR